ncbi:alginate lyase family protein [Bauldia litoralis]|uniref:alginate lyase family protein n=2 Tax=Bauldia litoralis TaxID=665467 RepID=UPI003263181A
MKRAVTTGPGSLGWYVRRLRNMPLREVAFRVSEHARKAYSRRNHRGWERFADSAARPPMLPGIREAVAATPVEARQAIDAAAADVLAGRFKALGVAWPQRSPEALFPAGIWRLDPTTGGLWPGSEAYTFDIAYRRQQGLGDVKQVWEFNRLQFLQPLAAKAMLDDYAAATAAIEDAIASWYDANPPFMGIAWSSGIELALRSISLLVVASLCGDRLKPETLTRIRTMLKAHAFWLARFPSRFSSANNHLIAEVAGEFLIAVAMPELFGAPATANRAQAVLAREALLQILPDGVPAEQSPTYGAFSVEFLLLCIAVGRTAGHPFPTKVEDRLDRFVDFVTWIAGVDGAVPAIGDDDEGRVLTLGGDEPRYVASVASAAAAWVRGKGPAFAGETLRNVIFGKAGTSPAPVGQRIFESGGYSVFRGRAGGRDILLVLDHGPLGYLSIAAHGHADALAIFLAVDGTPVLVDPGTFAYNADSVARDWFRGTRAHNTLSIDDADQSIMAGAFNWSHKATARLDERVDGPQWRLRASHDGYVKRNGLRHERTLAAGADRIHITDRLLGGGEADAEVCFQLAPSLDATRDGDAVIVSRGGDMVVRIVLAQGAIAIARGDEGLAGGWVSPSFGIRVPASRIAWRGRVGAGGVQFRIEV